MLPDAMGAHHPSQGLELFRQGRYGEAIAEIGERFKPLLTGKS